jgi:hypothetical protein
MIPRADGNTDFYSKGISFRNQFHMNQHIITVLYLKTNTRDLALIYLLIYLFMVVYTAGMV